MQFSAFRIRAKVRSFAITVRFTHRMAASRQSN
ncbi:Uncharacterised protein [Vibrio cholerae]|nr:Uncharacterised protein [Vibrio cholerae]